MMIIQDGNLVKLSVGDIIEVKDGLAIITNLRIDSASYSNYPHIRNHIKYASSFRGYEAREYEVRRLCKESEMLEKYPELLI